MMIDDGNTMGKMFRVSFWKDFSCLLPAFPSSFIVRTSLSLEQFLNFLVPRSNSIFLKHFIVGSLSLVLL